VGLGGGFFKLVLDEVGDDLGVGFGLEFVAFGDEGGFELEVVFDDAVVDDDKGAGAVAVGVCVFFGGAAVGGPAGVADAVGAVDGRGGDDGFEVSELAGGAAEFEGVGRGFSRLGGRAADGDAGGVVTAVFEAAQAFNDDGDDRLWTDVTDDSTHEFEFRRCAGKPGSEEPEQCAKDAAKDANNAKGCGILGAPTKCKS
jgi:hypothetical protein